MEASLIVGAIAAALALVAVVFRAARRKRGPNARYPSLSHDLGGPHVERVADDVGRTIGRKVRRDTLSAAVLSPPTARPGHTVRIWTIIAPPRQVKTLTRHRLQQVGGNASPSQKFSEKVARGSRLDVVLTGPLLDEAQVVQLRWEGRPLEASFQVRIPPAIVEPRTVFDVSLFVDRVCIGVVPLTLDIKAAETAPAQATLSVPRRVFISYSSNDRDVALAIARAYERIGVETFLDVLKIRGGDLWEERLAEEIDRSDAIYLLWSKDAAASKYVLWEVKRALDRRLSDPSRRPSIFTHIVGDPPPAAWPDELGKLQFNDPLLALWNQNIRKAQMLESGPNAHLMN